MKVKELILKLKEFDPETEIMFDDAEYFLTEICSVKEKLYVDRKVCVISNDKEDT